MLATAPKVSNRKIKTKLPRRYFKRARPRNTRAVRSTTPTESTVMYLGGRGTVARTSRQAVWANTFGKDILNVSRATHVDATMDRWRGYYSKGRLGGDNQPIAILVDGSNQRPVSNVSVFGQIAIVESPRGNEQVLLAVNHALQNWLMHSPIKDGDYINNIYVFADNSVRVDPGLFGTKAGRERLMELSSLTEAEPFYTIIATMPYAAMLERSTGGIGYKAWKSTRSKFGDNVAVRYRYYTTDQVAIDGYQETTKWYKQRTQTTGRGARASAQAPSGSGKRVTRQYERQRERYQKGRLISFPAINIGAVGAFNSGSTSVHLKSILGG